MGTFAQFNSIVSTQRVGWAKDNITDDLNTHGSKRAKFEEDQEKWAKEKEEMMARHLLELRKEIVRAWMRTEEKEWQKSREEWKQEANVLEKEFKNELKRVQKISADPPQVAPPKPNQSRTYYG
jgi:hypothetical protein